MDYSNLIKLYFDEKQNVAKNFPVEELNKLTAKLISACNGAPFSYFKSTLGLIIKFSNLSLKVLTHQTCKYSNFCHHIE